MSGKTVALVPGEGIGPEIVESSVRVLDAMGLDLAWRRPLVGDIARAAGLSGLPPQSMAEIDAADATLFGATSGPSLPVLRHLRWRRQTYANVRPVRWTRGYGSPLARPDGIDFVIVRENLEDAYLQLEGDLSALAPLDLTSAMSRTKPHEMGPGAYALKVITRHGCERVIRFAFALARRRKAQGYAGRVAASSKWNMLPQSDGLFIAIARELASDYPDIEFETFIIDDMAHRMIADPRRFDVVVLPNLYGDILSDAGAALVGGLGLAPSGCYGDDYAYFESAHGTAPDIAGQGIANPTATLLSAAMMLDYLDLPAPAQRLRNAIERVYADGRDLTPDQGGSGDTQHFADAVARALIR